MYWGILHIYIYLKKKYVQPMLFNDKFRNMHEGWSWVHGWHVWIRPHVMISSIILFAPSKKPKYSDCGRSTYVDQLLMHLPWSLCYNYKYSAHHYLFLPVYLNFPLNFSLVLLICPKFIFNMDDVVRARNHFRRSSTPEVVLNVLNYNVQLCTTMSVENNHTLVAFVFSVLFGFLQLKYSQNPTIFQIHPNTTFVSIASSLAYCFLFWIRVKFAIRRVNTLLEVFGSLSFISMVLMLLPNHTYWGGPLMKYIAYTIWFLSHVVAFIIKTLRGRGVMPPPLPYWIKCRGLDWRWIC